jgi:hypothetical protein
MRVIWRQMTFKDPAFFPPGQFVKDLAKLSANFPFAQHAQNHSVFRLV